MVVSVRCCAEETLAMSAAPGGRAGAAPAPTNAVSLKAIEVPQALQNGEKFIKWDEGRRGAYHCQRVVNTRGGAAGGARVWVGRMKLSKDVDSVLLWVSGLIIEVCL